MARKHTLRMAAAIFALALTTACSNPVEPDGFDLSISAQQQDESGDQVQDQVQDLRDNARKRKQER